MTVLFFSSYRRSKKKINLSSPNAPPGSAANPLFESRHELFRHEKEAHKG